MGKVTRVGGRGTSRRVTDKEADNWTGEAYRDLQKARKEASKDIYITMGRGTKKVKFSDIAETKGTSAGTSKGHWIRINRGTSRRWVPGK